MIIFDTNVFIAQQRLAKAIKHQFQAAGKMDTKDHWFYQNESKIFCIQHRAGARSNSLSAS